jgi:hypothetical protein
MSEQGRKDVPVDGLVEGVSRYIHTVEPIHDRLRRVLTQTAGYSLVVMTRGRRLFLLDVPIISARDELAMTRAELESVGVPAAARRHRDHVLAATEAIALALDCLTACLRPTADDQVRAELTRRLASAADHLRAATRLLPGFAMADLSQACCAVHARQPGAPICQTIGG